MTNTSGLFWKKVIVCLFILYFLCVVTNHAYAQPQYQTEEPPPNPAGAYSDIVQPVDVPRSVRIETSLDTTTDLPYAIYSYTHSDLLIFSYSDGTIIEVYDASNSLLWSGSLNESQHASLTPGAGVYRILGSEPYSVCVGDELTSFVLGYYALNQYGMGLSNLFYTYQSLWYSGYDQHFIVFAYEDATNVVVENTQTGAVIYDGVLNAGEHFVDTSLNNEFVTVRGSKPVSALSYTDQGYYVPSENGTYTGKTFYTYVGNSGGWPEDINLIAYQDSTNVTLSNTSTGAVIWSGVLNEGQVHSVNGINGTFITVNSDKGIAVSVAPFLSWTGNYYHSLYGVDSTGTGVGELFYFPVISGGNLILFSYEDGSIITIEDGFGNMIWSGTLNLGQSYSMPTSHTVYTIRSTERISALFDWGDHAGADFAPVYYGSNVSQLRGSLSLSASPYYQPNSPFSGRVVVKNSSPVTTGYSLNVKLLQEGVVLDSWGMSLVVPGNQSSDPIPFQFLPRPIGQYSLYAELFSGAELLDQSSMSVVVLSANQIKALAFGDQLTQTALNEIDQGGNLAQAVLKDGIIRVTVDELGGAAEQIFKGGIHILAAHYNLEEHIDTADSLLRLIMHKVKGVSKERVDEDAALVASAIISEGLEGKDVELQTSFDNYQYEVSQQDFTWTTWLSVWTAIHDTAIETMVEVRPYFAVTPIQPFIHFSSVLGYSIEYWLWVNLSWLISLILLVLAVVILIALFIKFLPVSIAVIILKIKAAAAAYALWIKVVGLYNALVMPIVLFAAALSIRSVVIDKLAPDIVADHDSSLKHLVEIIRQNPTENLDVSTQVFVDQYQAQFTTMVSKLDSSPLVPFLETHIYRSDGALIKILSMKLDTSSGEEIVWKETVTLPSGSYRAVTISNNTIHDTDNLSEVIFDITAPNIEVSAILQNSRIIVGEKIKLMVTLRNRDVSSPVSDLALTAATLDGEQFEIWSVAMEPGETETIIYEFVPAQETGGVIRVALSDAYGLLTEHDLAYAVNDDSGISVNVDESLTFQPGDVSLDFVVHNPGILPATVVLSLVTTLESDPTSVYSTTNELDLDSHSTRHFYPVIFPGAVPGKYRTAMLLDGEIYGYFNFTIAAIDALYSAVEPTVYFYPLGEEVNIDLRIVNSTFQPEEAVPELSLYTPEGSFQTLALTNLNIGEYNTVYTPVISGTFQVESRITRSGYRTHGSSNVFIVGMPSYLSVSADGDLVEEQDSGLQVSITNEHGVPINGVTVTLTGSHSSQSHVTDINGIAQFVIKPSRADKTFSLKANKTGFHTTNLDIPVRPSLDITPPYIFFDNIYNGQWIKDNPLVVTGTTEISSTLFILTDTVAIDANGQFTSTLDLTIGPNIITASAEDLSGNQTAITLTLHLDQTSPMLQVSEPLDGIQTESPGIRISGTTESSANVSVNEQFTPVNVDGSFKRWVILSPGLNYLQVEAYDRAGNRSEQIITVTYNPIYYQYIPQVNK